jgi:hypothetical protein
MQDCERKINDLSLRKTYDINHILYGDSAYIRNNYESTYVRGRISPESILKFKYFNFAANSARTSVEHAFGRTATLFPFVLDFAKHKVLQNSLVVHYYEVATILRNCYVILNGSQTNKAYNCYRTPTIKDYLHSHASEHIVCSDVFDRIDEELEKMISDKIKNTV